MLLRLALLAAALSSCASVDVIPRYGRLDFGGHIGSHASGTAATGTNSFDELGMATDRAQLGGRVDLEAAGAHTTLDAFTASRSGSGALQNPISDGSVTIPAGTAVDSTFDSRQGEAVVTWDLIPGSMLEAGIGFGASAVDLDASVRDPASGDEISTKKLTAIPLLAGRVGLDLGRVDLSVLFAWMDLDIGDQNEQMMDFDFMARCKLFGAAGGIAGAVVVGLRYTEFQTKYEDGSKKVDALETISSPYLGLSLRF
jgi:hypothetical protein